MFRLIEEMPEAAFAQGVDWRWGESFGGMVDALDGQPRAQLRAARRSLGAAPVRARARTCAGPRPPTRSRRCATCCASASTPARSACRRATSTSRRTSTRCRAAGPSTPSSRRCARCSASAAACSRSSTSSSTPGLTVSRVEMLGELSREHGIPTTLSPIFHSKAVPDGVRQGDGRRRARVGRGRAGVAAGADPSDRHQLDARPAQHHVPRDRRAGGRCSRCPRRKRSSPRSPTRDKRDRARRHDQHARERAERRPRPERLRRPRGRARAQPRPRRPHARRHRRGARARRPATCSSTSSVEEDLGTWFIRADIGHSDADAVGGLLAHPVRARRRERRRRARRLVRDLRRHRLPRSRGTSARPARCGSRRRSRRSRSTRRRSGGSPSAACSREGYAADVVVFDADTLGRGPEVASDDFPGEGIRWIRHSVGHGHGAWWTARSRGAQPRATSTARELGGSRPDEPGLVGSSGQLDDLGQPSRVILLTWT